MTILIFIKLFDFCRVLFWGGVGVLLLVRFTVKATNMAADLDNQGHPPLQYRVAEKKKRGGGGARGGGMGFIENTQVEFFAYQIQIGCCGD